MGFITSVASDGPFDVCRNPALLTLQNENKALGFFFKYRPDIIYQYSDKDNSYRSESSTQSIESNTKIDNIEIINNLGVIFAFSSKLDKAVIGFAISGKNDNQYSKLKREYTTYSAITGSSINIYSKTEEEISNFSPSFIMGIGNNITKTSSFGLQLISIYSSQGINSDVDVFIDDIKHASITVEKDITSISAELSFGYLYQNKGLQLGLLISSGEFITRRMSLEYNYTDISDAPASFVDNSSQNKLEYSFSDYSKICKYSKSPSLTAGGYMQINSYFAIALEGSLIIENSYKDRDLNLKNNEEDYYIENKKYLITTENEIIFKGGIELNPFKILSITTGGGYTLIKRTKSISEYNNENNIRYFETNELELYFATLGFRFNLGKHLALYISGYMLKLDSAIKAFEDSGSDVWDKEAFTNMHNISTIYDLGTGITISF
ncbi:MAG: hypothetical protein SVR08_05530 [Spirochaetota bacterium]|nr:hypothetical protein [Spirochaetota bacterium]